MHFYLPEKAMQIAKSFWVNKDGFGLVLFHDPCYITNHFKLFMGSSPEFKGKSTSGYIISGKIFIYMYLGVLEKIFLRLWSLHVLKTWRDECSIMRFGLPCGEKNFLYLLESQHPSNCKNNYTCKIITIGHYNYCL